MFAPITYSAESPPCVWGVRDIDDKGGVLYRITPMCMGSTVKIT